MTELLNILLYIQIGLSGVCLYRIIRGPQSLTGWSALISSEYLLSGYVP